jgi:hypothetical protein
MGPAYQEEADGCENQTDVVAIRFIADVAWAVRSASALAYVASITW